MEKNGELLYHSIFKKSSIKKSKIYLKDIASFYSGYSYSGNELSEKSDTCLVTIKNFDRNGDFKTDGFKPIIIKGNVKPTMYCNYGDLLVAHTDLTQNAEIIGNPIIITNTSSFKKIVISMDLVKVESNIIPNELLYYILKDIDFKKYALGYCSGTTVLHLSKKALSEYSFDYPLDSKITTDLSNKLKLIFNLKCNYLKQKDELLKIKQLYLNKYFN